MYEIMIMQRVKGAVILLLTCWYNLAISFKLYVLITTILSSMYFNFYQFIEWTSSAHQINITISIFINIYFDLKFHLFNYLFILMVKFIKQSYFFKSSWRMECLYLFFLIFLINKRKKKDSFDTQCCKRGNKLPQ